MFDFPLLSWGLLLLCLLIVLALWYKEHPSITDRGPPPGEEYPFWDDHSWGHLIGNLLLTWLFGLSGADPIPAVSASLIVWTAVEFAQRYPHDRQGGYIHVPDLYVNLMGATVGGLLCATF